MIGYQYLNVIEIIYDFIDANLSLFDLHTLTKDHSIDLTCLKRFIDFQSEEPMSKKFWDFYRFLYESIIYISNDTITRQYTRNAIELHELSKNGMKHPDEPDEPWKECNIVLILPKNKEKSNYYFTLYFLYIYRKHFHNDYKDLKVMTETDFETATVSDKKYSEDNCILFDDTKYTIFVVTDDFCYSGDQLYEKITDYQSTQSFFQKQENKHLLFTYANVIGLTSIASRSFTFFIQNIMIPSKCYIVRDNTYDDILKKYYETRKLSEYDFDLFYFTQENNVQTFSLLQKLIPHNPATLVYLSFKYPDGVSTIQNMCYFFVNKGTFFISCDEYRLRHNIKMQHGYDKRSVIVAAPSLTVPGLSPEEFEHECSLLPWVFEMKDISEFGTVFPQYVHTTDRNNVQVKLLKLMNNCDYDYTFVNSDRYFDINNPKCNDFCYNPFYKEYQYIMTLRTIHLDENELQEIKQRRHLSKLKRSLRRSSKISSRSSVTKSAKRNTKSKSKSKSKSKLKSASIYK